MNRDKLNNINDVFAPREIQMLSGQSIQIMGEGSGMEFKFSYGLNSAQEPSNCGGNPVCFCFNVPRRFQINTQQ